MKQVDMSKVSSQKTKDNIGVTPAGHGIVAAQVSMLTSSVLYCRVSKPCLGKGPVHHYLPA